MGLSRGGSGENAAISQSYHSRRPDGSLWVGAPMSMVETEGRWLCSN